MCDVRAAAGEMNCEGDQESGQKRGQRQGQKKDRAAPENGAALFEQYAAKRAAYGPRQLPRV
jgi:hypothetical protein